LEELSPLDNDVEGSSRQIANFHFNIKHSKPFDKVFQNLDKTVGDTKMIYSGSQSHEKCEQVDQKGSASLLVL